MFKQINSKRVRKDLSRAILLIWQCDRGLSFANFLLQLLQAVLPVISLYYIKEMIEIIVQNIYHFEAIIPSLIIFSLLQFALAIASQFSTYVTSIHQQKLTDYLSEQVLQKAVDVDYEYYENPSYHNTLHLAQQQSLYKATQVLSAFNAFVLNFLSLVCLVTFFFTMHSVFALAFVFLSLPLAMVKWYSGFALMHLERKFTPLEREAGYLHQVLTGVSYAKETRVFGFGKEFIQKFKNIRSHIHSGKRKLQLKLTWYSLFAESSEIIVMAIIFFLLAKSAFEKTITAGVFVIYIQAFQRLQGISKNFFQSIVQLLQQRIFLQDLFTFFDIVPASIPSNNDQSFPVLQQGLIIENLSFTYPETKEEVLHNINLQCPPGKIIAIVGENGSGKSTLVKLLARLYPILTGNILFNETSINDIGLESYRHNSTFLFQDFEKYFFSVNENIVLGEDSINKENKIKDAAEKSSADNFIQKLSKGYKTRMGRIFEGSEQLSTGQWQKLALARIFYKNASLIVLDEPTSSIDATAEFEIFKNFKKEPGNKIIILITHRLYNLKLADYIYVMSNGRIVEEDSFSELINHNGIFSKMYEAQKL